MASTSDIRDIMNLGQARPRQPAPKKKKHIEPQPRVTGVKREVQALMGDSVPPIAIVEQRSYKSRPSISQKLFKPRHWEERPFVHGGRTDGLVLRHWKRSIPGSNARAAAAAAVANGSADVEMTDESKAPTPAIQELRFEEEYPSHKWNVKVQVPAYTDEQYENLLRSEDWTRQETDYLMGLCRDYDLRWIIIADRYSPQDIQAPQPAAQNGEANGSDLVAKPHYPHRSMEALKQRYYAIAAKLMEAQTPASTMTQAEFQLWEKMRNFDAKTETMRKAMAEKLFERTKDEADEERILLEELHRITKNEDDFIKMRRDLYARLEPVAPIRRTERGEEQSTAMYQTSGGLSMLLQSLLAKEKRLKRPPVPGGIENGSASTPTESQRYDKGRHPAQYNRRDTTDTQATEDVSGAQKKGSMSQPTVRALSSQEEARFGVSHPQERITSGVQFRHEKINRLTMAKSQTQTTKIQAALTELGIPPRLLMPTERVCREFERLVTEINVLLDCRKVNEKIATEIKILEEARRIRLGLPKEGEQPTASSDPTQPSYPTTADAMEVDDSGVADDSKSGDIKNNSMAVAEEDQDAEAEDDVPPQKVDMKSSEGQDGKNESSMRVNQQVDDADADADADTDRDAAQKGASKPVEDQEEESEGAKTGEEDEDEDDEEQEDEGVTGVDEEEEEDEDDDDAEEGADEAQADLDEEDEEDEDADAEVAATPQNESDAEEDNGDEDEEDEDEDDEEEPEVEAEAESDEEESAQEDDDAGSDDEEEAEIKNQDEDEDNEEDGAPVAAAAAAAEADDDSDDDAEEEPDEEPPAAAAPSALPPRAHKRSASVISAASRAGSNRSGIGRKKRR
ncbi:uncharacterized protein Z520_08989 [Fonsecaea multimorphosa CBS 102226]|uniref:SWR1-complex protein 4 n=1 Tax=Fonsecaea multimorphosa CBS 102226 TaxID=1442371 RepID=A0A0D2JQ53_9EURO|nr:uncharacterized protein Z520_08989 [Fonsecaea multimorphosa CBS 102226]KIX95472.1 hypothetical protein Z520_08989 [Fonsecaea multimorphosa CBS 102226]OAL21003.1 hypothetical protein AYO22_08423 [Fonsecaea multimorphosa]